MSAGRLPILILGGGLAGGLAALALAARRPDIPLMLIEQGQTFGGNHVWSFFDSDVGPEGRELLEPMIARHWSGHEVRFPKRNRQLSIGYNSIRSEDFDRVLRNRLPPENYRLGRVIQSVATDHVALDGERMEGFAVIDARGFNPVNGLPLAWQKFVGRTYRFDRDHGVERPIIMDALLEQADGYRFLYSLPFSDTDLLLEDTYYSTSPELDVPRLGAQLDRRAANAAMIGEEQGVLPVVLGGKLDDLWPRRGPPVARIGAGGGFFHPTTSYSLPDAVRNAELLAQQRDFTPAALHALFRCRAQSQWRDRRFFRLLNRMLFRAAEPEQRYRVLEHFYRLPEAVIGRFYASSLSTFDKVRILSGRPPVPIGRALAAMREEAR